MILNLYNDKLDHIRKKIRYNWHLMTLYLKLLTLCTDYAISPQNCEPCFCFLTSILPLYLETNMGTYLGLLVERP